MIAAWMEDCRTIGEEAWGRYALRRDPQHARLQAGAQEYIREANACGLAVAEELLARFPGADMRGVAGALHLKVEDQPPFALPGYYLFAEFEEPDTIRVTRHLLELAEACADDNGLDFLHRPLEDHLLAHEIFHYLEGRDDTLYTRTRRVELMRLGPFRRTGGIRSLGEIAGMRFTQRVLGLSYSPFLLDILLLYTKEPKEAEKLYHEILTLKKENAQGGEA